MRRQHIVRKTKSINQRTKRTHGGKDQTVHQRRPERSAQSTTLSFALRMLRVSKAPVADNSAGKRVQKVERTVEKSRTVRRRRRGKRRPKRSVSVASSNNSVSGQIKPSATQKRYRKATKPVSVGEFITEAK